MNIKIVVTSKNEDFLMGEDKFAAEGSNVDLLLVKNNKKPLAKLYNEHLQLERDNLQHDFIVFMHSDVIMNINAYVHHLESVASKYDIIGLCGASTISTQQSPLNWWTGSNLFPMHKWGCVKHENTQTSFFSSHTPSVLDAEVACIDGVCIAMSKTAIQSGIMFDEELSDFNFYDTDISFQAIAKYKLRLGVIVQMDLIHQSIGLAITTDAFLESELKFRKKWNLEVPKNSKLDKYLQRKSQPQQPENAKEAAAV